MRVVSGVRRVVSVRIWLWGVSGVWVRGGDGLDGVGPAEEVVEAG